MRAGRCISFQVINPRSALNECLSAKWTAITQGPKLNIPFPIPPLDPQGSTGSRTWSPQPRPTRWLPAGTAQVKPGVAGRMGLSPPPPPGSPLQPKILSGRHKEQWQHETRSSLRPCSTAGLTVRVRAFSKGRSPQPLSVSAAQLAPPTELSSAVVLAARKLADTGAEKRRAKFLFISYEWGESVCRTHC